MRELIRTVRLTPYRKGFGPTFTLKIFDTGKPSARYAMRTVLGYELRQHEKGKTTILFAGDDFQPSCMHADDSDQTVAALMGFLTLRHGDTDDEYFANYNERQTEFCNSHAETLGAESIARFGND